MARMIACGLAPRRALSPITVIAVVGLVLSSLRAPAPAAAQGHEASTLGLGVNYLGGQLDYRLSRGNRLELRYLTGKDDSGSDRVSSQVLGLRGSHSFRVGRAYQPYLGVEGDYVSAAARGSGFTVSGAALGAFGGLERRLWKSLWAGADAGPFLFFLKEGSTQTSQTSVEFVANAYVMVYLF